MGTEYQTLIKKRYTLVKSSKQNEIFLDGKLTEVNRIKLSFIV